VAVAEHVRAVAGAGVAAAAAAAAADGVESGMRPSNTELVMTQDIRNGSTRRWLQAIVLGLCSLLVAATAAAAAAQKSFDSAQAAADALVNAVKAHDRPAILAILGPGTDKWIGSGDQVADRARGDQFVAAYAEKHAIEPDGDAKATLAVGPDGFPFAFPLVKSSSGWRFDTEAGKDELLARRVGENELAAINVMLAIVDAQHDYASADRNKDGVREYARRFESTAGKHDGLYWPTSAGESPSPLGPLVVKAQSEGYKKGDTPQPYHGYYFKPLVGQGKNAKGGAFDYVIRGHMIGGFGAVAYPARYASSGVMTFIVNHDGVVYQKDLGPNTAKVAAAITRFDPGPGWTAVPQK
jgi:hypothetical protein